MLYGLRGLFDHLKCSGDLILYLGKICRKHRPLGIDDHVRRNLRRKAAEPHRLAKAALHAVALYRPSQHPPHGKTDAKSLRRFVVRAALQIENRHVRREMPAPLLVNPFKIRMAQKPPLLGKPGFRLQASGFGLQAFFLRTIFRTLAFPEA